MSVDHEKLQEKVAGLSDSELIVVTDTADLVISTREARAEKIATLMRGIEAMDEISRFVVGLYLKSTSEVDQYMVQAGKCGWTEEFKGFSCAGIRV